MSQRYVLGLDIGSGHGACLLLNIDTGEYTTAGREWSLTAPHDDGSWGVDLDTDLIWGLVGDSIREAVQKAGVSLDQIESIAAASMRHSVVVVDKEGEVIFAAPTLDARAASQATQLAAEYGEQIYRRAGRWPLPIFTAARLIWLAERQPEIFQNAFAVLSVSDWINYRLTSRIAMERSLASETLLYDLKGGDWTWDLIDALGLPRNIFPAITQSGSVLGPLSNSSAEYLGLQEGISVITGGADTQCGLLGVGAVATGQLAVIAGSTTPIQLVTGKPILDKHFRLWTGLHVIPDRWVLESNVGQTGQALDWMAGFHYRGAREPVSMMAAAATRSEPGAMGMTSSLGATLFNARSMGVPIGNITFSPILANGDPERARHIARAVLEGMAYGVQANIEQIMTAADIKQPPIKMGGGIARSDLFAQILSNVSGTTVEVPGTTEATALGAAICAAVGTGIHPDLQTAAEALVKPGRRFTPQTEHQHTYRRLYENWVELRNARQEADLLAGDMVLNALAGQSGPEAGSLTPDFRPRILITASMSADEIQALRVFADVEHQDYREEMRLLSGVDLAEELQGFHVLVTEIDIVDLDALDDLPDLKVVVCCRGNPVNVDIEACTAMGIPVLNAPGRNADAVADITVAYMLMLERKLPAAMQFLREEGIEAGDLGRMGMAYEHLQGSELWDKKVGLIGLGAIGQKVAQRLQPFGAHVLAYDPYLDPIDATLSGVEIVPLDVLLAESDIVSLHTPVTDETRGLICAEQFNQMKTGSYLINTARAALIDEDALYQALKSGHLAGAALDVFSIEPPGAEHPLLTLPNLIATPHIGGNTFEVAAHQGRIVREEIERLLGGLRPRHVLNPATLEGFSWTAERKPLSPGEVEALSQKPGPGVSDLEVKRQPVFDSDEAITGTAEDFSAQPAPTKSAGLLSKMRGLMSTGGKEEPIMSQTTDSSEVIANMDRILRTFVDSTASDQALLEFSNKRDFTMYFLLTDFKKEFYLRFDSGSVTGDLTAPENPPDLTLKMKADILDGMFTGRINATRAAMTGKISFSGDTRKAMSMQKVQKDLTRLYSQAREQIGDPGDLTAADSEVRPAADVKIAPITPATPAATDHALVGDERDEIIPVLNELYNAGLITATGGNISLRREEVPDQVWITPSQIFKGDLRADMMVRIDMEGKPLDEDALSASSERLVHCAVYRARPDVQAVVHTHAPNTTILMLAGLPFQPISTEAAFIGDIPVVPFIMPGTQELGEAVTDAFGDGVAVFMQNHGLVVGGSSLRRAADLTEIIETTAEKLILLHLLGKEPPTLPDEIVEELSQYRDLMA